jgi:hypothetical protein
MTTSTWEYAVEQLRDATKPVTEEQLALAGKIGLKLTPGTSTIVAGALLRVALCNELKLPAAKPVSEHFAGCLKGLRSETKAKFKAKNDEEAAAWVEYLRLLRRIRVLTKQKFEAGDIVRLQDGEKIEVSSIGADGCVYFKGGQGYRSWPDLIVGVAARKTSKTAASAKARREAENAASIRASSPEWSAARSEDLAEFAIRKVAGERDVDELEEVIRRAKDEKPVQLYLQSRPYILTTLLGGKERFCIPQKSLGGKYIPDFVMADVDSLGVRWILVELETPRSGIYLKGGSSLDKFARKGVEQVMHWRDWLMNNIGEAQKPRRKHGLGLPDINNQAEGLVLVGSRLQRPWSEEAPRREMHDRNNIRIHSYDWLLDKLRGTINFIGPPSSNPDLLSRPPMEDPFTRDR